MKSAVDRKSEIMERKRRSHSWMESNFYAQWEQVYRSYLCEMAPATDSNTGAVDKTRTRVGAPDTWATINRLVARVTAQIPNLRFRCDDQTVAETISRTLMYQWDRAGIQRIQKKHVRQGAMFGWSVRPWYWERNIQRRSKRIDVLSQQVNPEDAKLVLDQYGGQIAAETGQNPQVLLADPAARGQLLARFGRGNLLPVRYDYVAYEGPKADYLFIGDCYPEPGFQSIQTSRYFIVERRRDRAWLERLAEAVPEFQKGIEDLFRAHPDGTAKRFWGNAETGRLRSRLAAVSDQASSDLWATEVATGEWTITEEHSPGEHPSVALLGEDSIWLGEMEYPYDLDGSIAFTELVLTDNLLHGVGDASVRVMRGIQNLHSRMISARADAYDYGLRPLAWTSDRHLYENPKEIQPREGYRLVYLQQGPNSWGWHDSSPVLNAAGASFTEEQSYARSWQQGTGETNISMMSGVDPQQTRTATGAALLNRMLDTLTRDLIDMFTITSLQSDAEMMFMLNRSELSDAVTFEPGVYRRGIGEDLLGAWVKAEPQMFQRDGQITVEAGSSLADDDEARVEKAQTLYQALSGNPLIDQKKLIAELLIAYGKGREINDYLAKEPPPGPPQAPPQPPVKASLSVRADFATLNPQVQAAMLEDAGIAPPQRGPTPPPAIEGPPMPQAVPAGPPSGILGYLRAYKHRHSSKVRPERGELIEPEMGKPAPMQQMTPGERMLGG